MYSYKTVISYLLFIFAERSKYPDDPVIAYYIYEVRFDFKIPYVLNSYDYLAF